MVMTLAAIVEAPPTRPPVRRVNGHVPPPTRRTGGDDDGGRDPEPRRPIIDNARLATIFLIAAETMLFAGLLSAFAVVRVGVAVWPPPLEPRLPVAVTGLNTLVLLTSSVAVAIAVRAFRGGMVPLALKRLVTGAALGAVFLGVQGYEWVRLVSFGLTASSGAYGGTFYTLIGAHALHVIGALAWLAIVLRFVRSRRIVPDRPAALQACAMYWHFVVGLWPVLYVVVYLL